MVLNLKFVILIALTIINIKGHTLPGRIIGGKPAPVGSFPYQVSVQVKGVGHWCGGAIIAHKTILTAAHCLMDLEADEVSVLVGTQNIANGGRIFVASELKVHEKFLKPGSGRAYDIGLVILVEPIDYSHMALSISLPAADTESDASVILTGWGTTQYPEENQPTQLQYLELKTISNEKCLSDHPNEIVPSNICTLTKKGEGSCHGDSGGPLVQSNTIIVGIVSWGDPCAIGTADVYTRVFNYVDWIHENGVLDP